MAVKGKGEGEADVVARLDEAKELWLRALEEINRMEREGKSRG